jgi:hypothetical protein
MGFANKLLGWASNNGVEVNAGNSLKVVQARPQGEFFSYSGSTGTIAAAVAASAPIFAMRNSPTSGEVIYINGIRIKFTTTVAFTVPITQTRQLAITRASGSALAGGTSVATPTPKSTANGVSASALANGGDIRIATTGALTTTGVTLENNHITMSLAHVGNAGNTADFFYDFDVYTAPIELQPGQVLVVRNGLTAMDAAGTWSATIDVDWRESATVV